MYFAYAVISTRRWIDREQREHQEAWAQAVLAEQLVGGSARGLLTAQSATARGWSSGEFVKTP
jgi:hypothetical protein